MTKTHRRKAADAFCAPLAERRRHPAGDGNPADAPNGARRHHDRPTPDTAPTPPGTGPRTQP